MHYLLISIYPAVKFEMCSLNTVQSIARFIYFLNIFTVSITRPTIGQDLHCRQHLRKNTYMCNIPSQKKGHNSFKIWWNHMKLKLDLWLIITKTYTKFQLNTSKHVEKKCGKLPMCNIPSPTKGHNSFKIWRNQTKHELDLWDITSKPYTKFQLNTSKHVEKKCSKLYCYDILSTKRDITHLIFDGMWRNVKLILGSSTQSLTQNFSSIPQSMTKKSAENWIVTIF